MNSESYDRFNSMIMEEEQGTCFISDCETNEIVHMTTAAMALFGMKSRDEYQGKKCYEVFQGLNEQCPFCANNRQNHGEIFRREHYNRILNRWINVEDRIVEIDGRKYKFERARDITDYKDSLKRLSDTLTMEEVLLDCLHTLVQEENADIAFNSFMEKLGRFYRADRAYIFEFNNDETMSNTYEWCMPEVSHEKDTLQNISVNIAKRWFELFEQNDEVVINSLENETDVKSDEYKLLSRQGIHSIFAVPLRSEGEIVGFLGIDNPTRCLEDLRLLHASTDFIMEELKKRRIITELETVAHTDMLTNLGNRNKYISLIEQYEKKPPKSLGVVFADLNGMKMLNDTYGHRYGDKMLMEVANVLKKFCEGNAFRIGGDEFVILCENVNRDEFEAFVHDLKNGVKNELSCSVSVGFSWGTGEGGVNTAITNADEDMYAEKQSYYHEVLENGQPKRLGLAGQVIKEVQSSQYVVMYQPKIDNKSKRIVGAEAFLRRKKHNGQWEFPDKFISYYENQGVIRYIDLFVFEEVCTLLAMTKADIKICVNVSGVTLMGESVVQNMCGICKKWGVSPNLIILKVSQSVSKIGLVKLGILLSQLKAANFELLLDDADLDNSKTELLNNLGLETVNMLRNMNAMVEESESVQTNCLTTELIDEDAFAEMIKKENN